MRKSEKVLGNKIGLRVILEQCEKLARKWKTIGSMHSKINGFVSSSFMKEYELSYLQCSRITLEPTNLAGANCNCIIMF